MTHHGLPTCLTADRGTEFKNLPLKEFAQLHKINLHYISVNNPASNGLIERFHSTILEHIRILEQTRPELSTNELMLYSVLGYNNSIHSGTNKKPIEIINGHIDTRDPFDINLETSCLQNYVQKHKEITKILYSKLNEQLQQKHTSTMIKHNENREKPLEYVENTVTYSKNPLAVRNKTQPRYITRKVSKDLGLKVLDIKDQICNKRNLRRPLRNQRTLLQDASTSVPSPPGRTQRATNSQHLGNINPVVQ